MVCATARLAGASGVAPAAYALLAFALYSGTDAALKQLSGSYHPFQLAFFNALFSSVPVLALAARGGWGRLRTARPRLHALRGALALVGTGCTCYAFAHLSLADTYAVLFTVPLLVTALSVPLLGERVGWRRWSAVALGFCGVVLMIRPEAALFSRGGLAAGVSALVSALCVLLVRGMQPSETRESLSVYGTLAGILGMGAALPFVFTGPTLPDLLLSALGGLLSGTGFLLLIQAYRLAPAAAIAPCQYTQMPYGLLLGVLLFGAWPEPLTLVGAAVVMASGLFILQREARLRPADVRCPPASGNAERGSV
jgi:drug/metabolite transporter (DMT)-like permease